MEIRSDGCEHHRSHSSQKRRQPVHRPPPHRPDYRTNDLTRLYAKIVSATPMNTTPHATMSPFTLVIVVEVAASTGNTCAMASPAISSSPTTNSPIFLNICTHPLSLHDHTDRKASQETRPRPIHQGIHGRLIHPPYLTSGVRNGFGRPVSYTSGIGPVTFGLSGGL